MKKLLLTMILSVFSLLAADIDGKWTAEVPGREGAVMTQTYEFKAEGDKLTGKMSGPGGREMEISDGKISGEDISFKVNVEFNGNSMTWNYTGKLSGGELKLKREGGRGPAREITAKKVKAS
jgi:hypothetical protein